MRQRRMQQWGFWDCTRCTACTCGSQLAKAVTTVSAASVSTTATMAVVPSASNMTDWTRPMPADVKNDALQLFLHNVHNVVCAANTASSRTWRSVRLRLLPRVASSALHYCAPANAKAVEMSLWRLPGGRPLTWNTCRLSGCGSSPASAAYGMSVLHCQSQRVCTCNRAKFKLL